MAVNSREAVIDYEFLRGRQNETVVKELCVASAIASETFRFKPPLQDGRSRIDRERHKLNGRPYLV